MINPELGKLAPAGATRDAIHFAVAPVVASQDLTPGQHVGLSPSGEAEASPAPIGIVDPFFTGKKVKRGDRFYLMLYPNTIQSLRHEWAHPAFPQEQRIYVPAGAGESEKWIREYADSLGLGYSVLMEGADEWIRSRERDRWGDYLVMGGLLEGESTSPEFWNHYEIVRGTTVKSEVKENFFSCSC